LFYCSSEIKDAPTAEDIPNTEDAPKLETSEVPDKVLENSPPSGRCAEDIRQETSSVKEARHCPECSTLREKIENLAYANECLKGQIEGLKKVLSEKDLKLEVYGGIDNDVEALLLTLRSGDVEVGQEGEDIFGGPYGVQIAALRTVERINILSAGIEKVLSENEDLKIQLGVIGADRVLVTQVSHCFRSFC
jgi:hypothetical protein